MRLRRTLMNENVGELFLEGTPRGYPVPSNSPSFVLAIPCGLRHTLMNENVGEFFLGGTKSPQTPLVSCWILD